MTRPLASLDHIGIAVSKVPELKKLFMLLGLASDHSELVPDQGVRTHFIPLPASIKGDPHPSLELLEVTDPKGTVARFLEKRGPGVHHLSFRIAKGQLDALCTKLLSEGYRLTYDVPRQGAHQMRINFIYPASAGGILIELMEPTG